MTSSRPYLIRGLYEWIMDNYKTPYIVVNADAPDVIVPREYVNNGKIILNISSDAIDSLVIDNLNLQFHAKFSGISHHLHVPISAVIAIYAQENGAGMVFGQEPGGDDDRAPPTGTSTGSEDKKPKLKIVK